MQTDKQSILINKMVIAIKEIGPKICNMEKENKNIKMEINLTGNLCMETNSEKEFINLAVEKYTKATFTMDIVTDLAG